MSELGISIDELINRLRALYRDIDCAVACVSGGVDSTTSAVLAKKALGDKVYPVFINTGFMRMNEGARVREALKGILDLEIYDFSEEIISRIEGLEDAEEKRIAFRDAFYMSVKKIAEEKKCGWIVQGTIKADVVETVGKIKTQHNVLSDELLKRYGLKVIEPVIDLYKHEVRALAKQLGLPKWLAERQPFPGPGLLVRTVGKLYREKLELVRKATAIVEERLNGRGYSQYFPAIWEHDIIDKGVIGDIEYLVFKVKATGVIDGRRIYGHPVMVRRYNQVTDVYTLYKQFNSENYPHILLQLREKEDGEFVIAIRIVKTEDYMVAEVPRIDIYKELNELAEELLSLPKIKTIAFDVTPKPPATIEYE
ncbi:MAG: GMP synthase [Ignisphaera sp.]